jgi:isoamylase
VKSDGTEMSEKDWDTAYVRSMGMFLNGNGIRQRDARGVEMTDEDFLIYFNADDNDVEFTLPSAQVEPSWDVVVDTAGRSADSGDHPAGTKLTVSAKSLVVLRAHIAPEVEPDHSVAASLAVLAAAHTDASGASGPKVVREPAP